MLGRKSHRGKKSPWIVAEIDDSARLAAEQAAAKAGTPLEIWLADTVLRACQEGIESPIPDEAKNRQKPFNSDA